MARSNAETVREIFRLFEAGESEAALALYDEQVVLEAPGSVIGGAWRGRDGLLALAARLRERLPGVPRFEVLSVVAAGDTVLVEIGGSTTAPGGREAR